MNETTTYTTRETRPGVWTVEITTLESMDSKTIANPMMTGR